ncbi:hypothetical protein DBA29_03590 [Xenophilus aerolatus]|nr:hypothetical protein [Xenophilus aerolatus]
MNEPKPGSPEDFREHGKRLLQLLGRFAHPASARRLKVPPHPYEFAHEDALQLEAHLYHMWELFDKGRLQGTVSRPPGPETDKRFQKFLKECLKA